MGAHRRWPLRISRRRLILAATSVLVAAGVRPMRAGALPDAAPGASVDPLFERFYERHGGAPVLGEPLTLRFERNGRSAQLFGNFLLEHWPEHAGTPYEVQPALLGALASGFRYFGEVAPFRSWNQVEYLPATRHSLRFGFLDAWRAHGSADLLGLPISEEVPNDGVTAQWFQRGRLSYDPLRAVPVQFDDIGRQWLAHSVDDIDAEYALEPLAPAEPDAAPPLRVTLTNRGRATWPSSGPDAVALGFRWADPYTPADHAPPSEQALPRDLPPGEALTLEVPAQLPSRPGQFRLQPDLRQRGEWFSSRAVAAPLVEAYAQLATPDVRVGLLDISDDNPDAERATITSTNGMVVRDEGGALLAETSGQERISIERDIANELQLMTLPDGSRVATVGKVLVAPQDGSMLRLLETDPWTTYRGTMEFAWLPAFTTAWVINTLPMEDYLSGIVEQGDHIGWEALRASVIAFRSYGSAVRTGKRARGSLFDVAASTHHTPTLFTRDHVYHGMAREFSGTRLRDAAEATRGMVMAYAGETIMSVYFSRADGRTRSWHDVWGGRPKPWAMGVPDPYSVGQRLLGHGIGLPLRSANAMAADGANAEQILTAYYTGIDFQFIY